MNRILVVDEVNDKLLMNTLDMHEALEFINNPVYNPRGTVAIYQKVDIIEEDVELPPPPPQKIIVKRYRLL